MIENDLSDEAFWSCTDGMTRLQAWQECRRRAEERERKAISFAIGRVLYADGIAPEIEVDETYHAFLQERKGKNDPSA